MRLAYFVVKSKICKKYIRVVCPSVKAQFVEQMKLISKYG